MIHKTDRTVIIGLSFLFLSIIIGTYLVFQNLNISNYAESLGDTACEEAGGIIINDPDSIGNCPDGYQIDTDITLDPLITGDDPDEEIQIPRICCVPLDTPTPTTPEPTSEPTSEPTPEPTESPTVIPSPTPRACVEDSKVPYLQVDINIEP